MIRVRIGTIRFLKSLRAAARGIRSMIAGKVPENLSTEEAARILGITIPILRHRMSTGRLHFIMVDGQPRMALADVLDLKKFEDRRRRFAAELGSDTEDLEGCS